MKDVFDVTEILYNRLYQAIGTSLSGDIYKDDRPDSSILEDITINSLPITSGQPQLATANVNLHVPDLKVSIKGKGQYVPNHSRIKALLSEIKPLLEVYTDGDYNYFISSINHIRVQEKHESLINIRIDFLIINT